MPQAHNPNRQAKQREMAAMGTTSGKTYRRRLKALRPVKPQYRKINGILELMPTKRLRIAPKTEEAAHV